MSRAEEGGGRESHRLTLCNGRIIEQDGVKLVTDEQSLAFLAGSTIDYSESLMKSAFQVATNPHAVSSCGCHSSFTPKFEET